MIRRPRAKRARSADSRRCRPALASCGRLSFAIVISTHAAARDHTWPAAWQKVVTRLREQIEQRRSRQTARQKGQPHIHRPTDRRAK